MAAGSAIVAVGPPGSDPTRTVNRYRCGLAVMPGDAKGLAQALVVLASDPEQLATYRDNARRAAMEDFDLRELARRWHHLVDEVCRRGGDGLTAPDGRPRRGYEGVKRLLDVVTSAVGLVVLAPLLGVAAAGIRLTMGSPVLFRQGRAGLGGKTFTLLKFRTMRPPRAGEDGPGYDAARLTRLGRWLRATSIDELPTLWNVLRGDMSLVGPRPLFVKYVDRYTRQQARRHEVKPGITGWAQINGRNALNWEEKFALDVEYVEHRSLGWDLAILARTLWKVVRAEGISQQDHATMPEFVGGPREEKYGH
jgi:lipopolysaccharide/colanic/teichoic acid biosynthesis glycosyltransferase